MRVPHLIPYQGSKRNIAKHILSFFPTDIGTLVEPFAGSAAVSLATAFYGKAKRFHINDINEPLMQLWRELVEHPKRIANAYRRLWREQLGDERLFYDKVRDEFNRCKRPEHLLYLLARCVKASVRYNDQGEFNQSPDNRRNGREPDSMEEDIVSVSALLRSRVKITSQDYREILQSVRDTDLVYMDPPYQGVCNRRDSRYSSGVAIQEITETLKMLVDSGTSFILSYDGRCGNKTYGRGLPHALGLAHIEIEAGRSAQATLLGREEVTYESVYLSDALVRRLRAESRSRVEFPKHIRKPLQLTFGALIDV